MRSKTLSLFHRYLVAMLVFFGSVAVANAQDDVGVERSIEGVWRATFTPRICATGAPIPTAAFEALYTFHADGSVSVWTQNNVITITRSPGHGLWKRKPGWEDYSLKVVNLHYNLATGAYLGRQEATGTFVLSASGDEYTSTNSTTVFDASGNPVVSACSTSVGTRFKLDD